MKEKPIILTTSFSDENSKKEDFGFLCVKRPYIECLNAFGALPLIVPFQDDEENLRDGLDTGSAYRQLALMADGLLLPGGEDVHPGYYGGEDIHESSGPFSSERDSMEMNLVKVFVEFRKPIFGICRGAQILNVALGGTLYQDIKSETATFIRHEFDPATSKLLRYSQDIHEVFFLKETALASFFGCEKITVNSLHHQSIKNVAETFCVNAIGEDGIIEGIESKDMITNWILGVQWHPEAIVKEHPEQAVLFEKFIDAASKARNMRS